MGAFAKNGLMPLKKCECLLGPKKGVIAHKEFFNF